MWSGLYGGVGEGECKDEACGAMMVRGCVRPHSAKGAVLVVHPVDIVLDLDQPEEGVEEYECLEGVNDGVWAAFVLAQPQDVLVDVVGGLHLPAELVGLDGLLPGEVERGDEHQLLALRDAVFWHVWPEIVCVEEVVGLGLGLHSSAGPPLVPLAVSGSGPPVHDCRDSVQDEALRLPPLFECSADGAVGVAPAPEEGVYAVLC